MRGSAYDCDIDYLYSNILYVKYYDRWFVMPQLQTVAVQYGTVWHEVTRCALKFCMRNRLVGREATIDRSACVVRKQQREGIVFGVHGQLIED
jgi:hypothetical protein